MINKHKSLIIIGLTVVLVLLVIMIYKSSFLSNADSEPLTDPQKAALINKAYITIWGKVTNKEIIPLPNILIKVANTVTITKDNGDFVLTLDNSIQQGEIQFYDRITGDRYQFANASGHSLYFSPSMNLHQDFVVEKMQ